MSSEVGELLEEFEDFEEGFISGPSTPASEFLSCPAMLGPGVYALLRGDTIIYVGKAKVLLQRLYAHWNMADRIRRGKVVSDKTNVKSVIFTGFQVYPCLASDLDRVEREMIARHRPRYNHRLVPKGKSTLSQVGFDYTRLGVTLVQATPVFVRRRF